MENYKPNSHKYKEGNSASTDKKIEQVTGIVKTKKKSEIGKIADAFIAEDAKSVWSYILMDVLVPAAKKAISDIVTNGVDMFLYGESGRHNKNSNNSYVSYRSYSDNSRGRSSEGIRTRSGGNFDEIIFETRGEAEMVREQMNEMIDRYGIVTVGDMYDMARLTPPYTSNKYGWTSIRTAEVIRERGGGYIIKLPRPAPMD